MDAVKFVKTAVLACRLYRYPGLGCDANCPLICFLGGDIEGLNIEQLKNFIKARANEKMIELGYKPIYNDIDPNLLKQMEWFGHLTSGKSHTDFFSSRVTNYSKSVADWSDI